MELNILKNTFSQPFIKDTRRRHFIRCPLYSAITAIRRFLPFSLRFPDHRFFMPSFSDIAWAKDWDGRMDNSCGNEPHSHNLSLSTTEWDILFDVHCTPQSRPFDVSPFSPLRFPDHRFFAPSFSDIARAKDWDGRMDVGCGNGPQKGAGFLGSITQSSTSLRGIAAAII